MDKDIRSAAVALYDRYTHEGMDRRAFMAELTRIAGSAGAASLLLAGIAADPAAAAIIAADDRRVTARRMSWPVTGGGTMKGYQAQPRTVSGTLGSVVVVHENRGLNAYTEDVARRLAIAGYRAVAPDFLSIAGGTPSDPDTARAAIGKLDLARAAADGLATLGVLKALPEANGKVGVIGFCWGGAMVNRLAVAAGPALGAGIAYYGTAPDPTEAGKVEAATMLHLAGRDERVNKTALPWSEALRATGKTVETHVYADTDHAFHNDTSAERYNAAAARLSWQRTLDFLKLHVG